MPIYKCKPCSFESKRKLDYQKHLLTNKHLKNNLICFRCSKQYKVQKYYKDHMDTKACEGPPKSVVKETERLNVKDLVKDLIKRNEIFHVSSRPDVKAIQSNSILEVVELQHHTKTKSKPSEPELIDNIETDQEPKHAAITNIYLFVVE